VAGGATRSESVSNALAVVETELVAIHDAARPLVTPELIAGVLATLEADPEAAGAVAAAPVTDTIKRSSGGGEAVGEESKRGLSRPERQKPRLSVGETLDRDELWAAQTPQAFRTEVLREALAAASDEDRFAATDEAMLVEAAGGRVLIHPAPPENLKVTTPLDLKVAEQLLSVA
jgi:2-C-methyl-D-erythritol 4-phosphate cytidylyltransferase